MSLAPNVASKKVRREEAGGLVVVAAVAAVLPVLGLESHGICWKLRTTVLNRKESSLRQTR